MDQRNPHRSEELLRLEDEREELEEQAIEALLSWVADGSHDGFQMQGLSALGQQLADTITAITELGGQA